MLNYAPKTIPNCESCDGRSNQRSSQNHTPSKRSKYDSFTPRKRYMKEQEQYEQYRNMQFQPTNDIPPRLSLQMEAPSAYYSNNRSSSIRKKQHIQPQQAKKYSINDIYPSNFEKLYPTEARVPLNEYTLNPNCPTSARQAKFKNYLQNREICKKICFQQDQNRNKMNIVQVRAKGERIESNRQRFLDIETQSCLTPRRLNKKREENYGELNEKLSMVQAKIAKLERMTPKRTSAAKMSQIIEAPLSQFSKCQPQRQQTKPQSAVSSRVSVVSQRQNQIMSRVSLGRLVQQQQCETEIEMIQDLSYKISSKLRSIIRNFG